MKDLRHVRAGWRVLPGRLSRLVGPWVLTCASGGWDFDCVFGHGQVSRLVHVTSALFAEHLRGSCFLTWWYRGLVRPEAPCLGERVYLCSTSNDAGMIQCWAEVSSYLRVITLYTLEHLLGSQFLLVCVRESSWGLAVWCAAQHEDYRDVFGTSNPKPQTLH